MTAVKIFLKLLKAPRNEVLKVLFCFEIIESCLFYILDFPCLYDEGMVYVLFWGKPTGKRIKEQH